MHHTHSTHPQGWYIPNLIRKVFRPLSSLLYPLFDIHYFRALHALSATKGLEYKAAKTIFCNLWINAHGGQQATREEIKQLLEKVEAEGGTTAALAKCPCRIALHNKYEDWCIFLGDIAKSWLRFKKRECRQVSLEEVKATLEKAKEKKLISCPYICTTNKLYAICNCGPQDCVPLHLEAAHGIETAILPGVYVAHTTDKCRASKGCGQLCRKYCYFGAIKLGDSGQIIIDGLRCHGCGLCYENCPSGAIEMKKERERIINWASP